MKRRALTILLLSLVIIYLPAEAQDPDIGDILSAPETTALTGSENHDHLAWVINHEGRRSLWVALPDDYLPRELINYGQDDGRGISGLNFSPEGEFLIYTLGSQYNPTSHPDGANAEIFRIETATGDTLKITDGSGAVLSPDGETIVYSHQGTVHVVPADGSEQSSVLFSERGSSHSLSWSPDGSKLLFVSSREAHSFIGVYHFEDHSIQWIDPDVYRDVHPVWSPEGDRIAFIRTPGGMRNELPGWRRADLHFSIRVYDLNAKEGRAVWKSSDGGGFAQSYPDNPLSWGANDHLIFYSEHSGWMNLYSVDAGTGEVVSLAEGNFEVEELALSPDRQTVVFNSNEGDINRRHLWSVSVDGSQKRQLTEGDGIEWGPVFTSSGEKIAYIRSDAKIPGQPALMRADGSSQRMLAPESIPDRFPADQLVTPGEVTFTAADGVEVHGQLFLPPDYNRDNSHPAVIYMHGGPIRQMYPAWHSRGYYHKYYAFNQYLALQGYVVLSINFRSGIGYGADFRTAPEQGPRGASEYQDILAGARFLQHHDAVDPLKIGLWGGSYGGYLTALGLARDSNLFAAGVDLHGVHDWALRGERRNGGGWGVYTDEQMELARRSSPVYDVEWWRSPVLFIHADDDRNVDFIQTTDLVRRLEEVGKAHVETLVFPDDVHSFLLHRRWVETFEVSADFFERFLR